MAKHVPPKKRMVIPSAWLVHALGRSGRRYECRSCGERMFVVYESGLCPLCFNGRSPDAQGVRHVPPEQALVGVPDELAIEGPGTGRR